MQLKSANAYTRQFKLKLSILIVYILKKKGLRAYSGLIDMFVNYYDVEAVCVFFTYGRFLIKLRVHRKQHKVAPSTF